MVLPDVMGKDTCGMLNWQIKDILHLKKYPVHQHDKEAQDN